MIASFAADPVPVRHAAAGEAYLRTSSWEEGRRIRLHRGSVGRRGVRKGRRGEAGEAARLLLARSGVDWPRVSTATSRVSSITETGKLGTHLVCTCYCTRIPEHDAGEE